MLRVLLVPAALGLLPLVRLSAGALMIFLGLAAADAVLMATQPEIGVWIGGTMAVVLALAVGGLRWLRARLLLLQYDMVGT